MYMKTGAKSSPGSTRWIVHEIRNPLSAILLANQLAEEQLREEQIDREALLMMNGMVAKNVARIEQILRDISSKLQEQTAFFPVDITQLMDHALQQISDRVEMQKLTILRSYGDPVVIMADGEQLTIAFVNVLVNAIEAVAREKGKIWITILKAELKAHVAHNIGALARPDDIRCTDALPKTRSGKIMRRFLRDVAAGRQSTGDATTLEDYSVLARLREDEE